MTCGKLVDSPSQSVIKYPEPFFKATLTKIIISTPLSDQLWLPSNPAYNSTAQFYYKPSTSLLTKQEVKNADIGQVFFIFLMDKDKVVANKKRTK